MSEPKLDEIDLKILQILQQRGRTKRNELAEQVNLSIPSISERLRKLEEYGIIKGYHAVLEARKVGLEVTAFIFIISESSQHYPEIIKEAQKVPEVLECHAITGEGSHLLKVRTQSTASLERLLSTIQSWPGVINTRTSIVLSSPKETTVLPLEHLQAKAVS
ncbi:MAG: Lrp/AsnC family transcriptional regulator [Calditrichaeota bacterium]|nr:MAG: Lrp/AsnC family transcriptional regulator [Calditrichota bacterium]